MASCRSTSFYLAPGVYRRFSQYALAAVLPTGEIVEISHRKMIKDLIRDHPLWDGLVLCVGRSVLGKSGIVDTLINKPSSVERWYVDERVIEGRRPTGRAYTLHRLAHGGVEAIGGLQQVRTGLLSAVDPAVRRAAVKLIEEAGRGAAYRISIALAAQDFLDAHTIANLLRIKTPYEHTTFAPVNIESVRTAFAVLQARYPTEYQSCIVQMLDGSSLGPTWLSEYTSLRYDGAGLGAAHYSEYHVGKSAWILISKLYGGENGYGRDVSNYDFDGHGRTLGNHYRLPPEDAQMARTRLTQYVMQLASTGDLPETATILRALREQPGSVPHSVLYDPRLMSDPASAHQVIVGLIERTKPDASRGESGTQNAALGKPYPIYSQNREETLLYEAVARHNFSDETIESLLTELDGQQNREIRRVLGGVLQIALHGGTLTAGGMERLYTRLCARDAKPGSLEARLVEALLARRDLPVNIAETHVREHMDAVDGTIRTVLSTELPGFGSGWQAYPRGRATDTYSALGVVFSNPHLLAASPYLREQARTFVRVGMQTASDVSQIQSRYGSGESPMGPRTKRIGENVMQNVTTGLLSCAAGSEEERGEALRIYAEGRRKMVRTSQGTGLPTSETMIIEHFSTYQPSKPCDTLEELWRDYCAEYQRTVALDPVRSEFPQRWYENIAVNPNLGKTNYTSEQLVQEAEAVGSTLRKLAYTKSDDVLNRSPFDNDVFERRGEYDHLLFLERVIGSRCVADDLREAALARHVEKQPAYVIVPSSYGGLALATQVVSDQSATDTMLALVITGLETRSLEIIKKLDTDKVNHDNDQRVREAEEIDLILHMVEGRTLTGDAAEAWRRCVKSRLELREMIKTYKNKSAVRETLDRNIYSDTHLHQKALAGGAVVSSFDESKLEEMLTLFERERATSAHGSKADSADWPTQITGMKDLPGYGHLPFADIEEFSGRIDGSDYDFPKTGEGLEQLSRVETISSGGELRQNAEYMGNCTAGYARSIARGMTRIVAVYDTDGNCALNLSFERRAGNAFCPTPYRSLVSQILTRLNEDGDGWGLAEINTRFNGLGYAAGEDWEDDWTYNEPATAEPLLNMGSTSEAEERAWEIQERFDTER